MRSEVRHEDGRLLVTAIGSYTIFPPPRGGPGSASSWRPGSKPAKLSASPAGVRRRALR